MTIRYITALTLKLLLLMVAMPAFSATTLEADSFVVYNGDVNGDGIDDIYLRAKDEFVIIAADIIIPIKLPDSKSLLINGADGALISWTNPVDLSGLKQGDYDAFLGDFDGNGIKDILYRSNSTADMHFFLLGSAGDQPASAKVFDTLVGQDLTYASIDVRDVNNDGKDDVVFSALGEYFTAIAGDNASFTMVAPSALPTTNLKLDSFDLFQGDVNGDGIDDIYLRAKDRIVIIAADIAIPITFQDSKSMLINGANGKLITWMSPVDVSRLQTGNYTAFLGDFNGDKVNDILFRSNAVASDSIFLFGGVGDQPAFAKKFNTLIGQDLTSASIAVRDVNTDGKDDVVFSVAGQSFTAIAGANATFSMPEAPVLLSILKLKLDSFDLFNGDVNGDGIDDVYLRAKDRFVIIAADVAITIVIHDSKSMLIDGANGQLIPWVNPVDVSRLRVGNYTGFLGDFNGDGIRDILYRSNNSANQNIILFGGAGDQASSVKRFDTLAGQSIANSAITIKDINADGRDDILINTAAGNTINVLAQAGGNFETKAQTQLGQEVLGATAGSFNVGSDGSGAYSIPIAVPVGGAGMQPALSFSYNSGAREGSMGVGWSVTSASMVSRCPRNIARDGAVEGVSLTAADKFCLNGQRLVAVSGVYGANNTEYRTESDMFARITSHGSGVYAGPAYFKVEYKSGEIAYLGDYGNSAALDDVTGSFHLAKIIDRSTSGNARTYTYVENETTGEHYPTRIDYPGGYVAFSYRDIRARTSWFQGHKIIQQKQLYDVSTYTASSLYRAYHLAYETSPVTKSARLLSLQECGSDGACLKSTTFEWTGKKEITAQSFNRVYKSDICANESAGCNDANNHNTVQYVDVNGDSFTDVCWRSDTGIECRLGNLTILGNTKSQSSVICADGSDCGNHYYTLRLIDMNHDNRADAVYSNETAIYIAYMTNAGFGSFAKAADIGTDRKILNSAVQYADINGDASIDACYRTEFGIDCRLGGYTSALSGALITSKICKDGSELDGTCNDDDNYKTIKYVDVNGDGKSDLVFRSDSGIRVYSFNGVKFSPTGSYSSTICGNGYANCNDPNNHEYISFGDVTGDGLPELCYRSDVGVRCHINTGTSFSDTVISSPVCSDSDARCNDYDNWSTIQFVDVNDDGISDLFYRSDDGLRWILSTGTTFKGVFSSTICKNGGDDEDGICNDGDNHNFQFSDVDADGLPDLAYRGDQGLRVYRFGADRLPDYMVKVTNGFDLTTRFSYSTYRGEFESTAYADFDTTQVLGPINVVSQVTIDAKVGTKYVSYAYEGLRYQYHGAGSLGFKKMTVTEGALAYISFPQRKTVNNYLQNWQVHQQGMLSSAQSYVISNGKEVLIGSTSNTYKTKYRSGSSNKIWNAYQTSSIQNEYELNGVMTKTSRTMNTLDLEGGVEYPSNAYGNTLKVTSTISDGHLKKISSITSSEYAQENASSWILGRVTRSTAVQSSEVGVITSYESYGYRGAFGRWVKEYYPVIEYDNSPTITKTSSWHYDVNGFIESETIEPDNTTLSLSTHYTYNNFGLKATARVSATNSSDSTTSYEYDGLGRYVTSVKNALGQRVSTQYNPVNGQKSSVTGINGLTAYWQYDGFGRVNLALSPNGTYSKTTISLPSGNSRSAIVVGATAVPPAYMVTTTNQNGVWSKAFFTKFGDSYESQSVTPDGRVAVAVKEYDARGRAYKSSAPFELGGAPSQWTTTSFDILNRPVTITNLEGKQSSYSYNGLSTTITNEKSQTKTELRLPNGKLASVTDNDGNKVSYSYDGAGNMTSMSDPQTGSTTLISYDNRGHKIAMTDPDKGTWSYTYNNLGVLVTQTDAEGNVTCNAYDILGRMIKRVDAYQGGASNAVNQCAGDNANPKVAIWEYDTAANGLGKLRQVRGENGFSETYTYDVMGKPTSVTKQIHGKTFVSSTTYDDQGRPVSSTFPSGLKTFNHYNSLGSLVEISKGDNASYYWQLGAMNIRGQVTEERLANGVITTDKSYTPAKGHLESIVSSSFGQTANLQFNFAQYDELGNIHYRRDDIQRSEEIAHYDSLNRLQWLDATVAGVVKPRQQMSYAANGNINTKWDVAGTYAYGGTCNGVVAGPHAATTVSGTNYCYDRNGNMVSGAGRSISWTSFGKPSRFEKGSTAVDFEYGPSRNRIRRIDLVNGAKTVTTYAGGYELVEKGFGITEKRHYIGGFAVVTETREGASLKTSENYMLKDNLGSVVAYVDADKLAYSPATAIERSSFDAWGKRRGKDWAAITDAALYSYKSAVSDLGFTGHEQIDAVGLVHMNGRVYDPIIGRFISADPIIQDPTDLQSLNRYTYVRNNPLTLTDPSGFSWWSKTGRRVVGIAFAVTFPTIAMSTGPGLREFGRFARKNKYVAEAVQIGGCLYAPGACPLITAGVTYGITDGDFKASIKAGAIAYASAYIGDYVRSSFNDYLLDAKVNLGTINKNIAVNSNISISLHIRVNGWVSSGVGGVASNLSSSILSNSKVKASSLGLSFGAGVLGQMVSDVYNLERISGALSEKYDAVNAIKSSGVIDDISSGINGWLGEINRGFGSDLHIGGGEPLQYKLILDLQLSHSDFVESEVSRMFYGSQFSSNISVNYQGFIGPVSLGTGTFNVFPGFQVIGWKPNNILPLSIVDDMLSIKVPAAPSKFNKSPRIWEWYVKNQ